MEKCTAGDIQIEVFEGDLIVHIATEGLAVSFILEPEEARKLSSELFKKYVETLNLSHWVYPR